MSRNSARIAFCLCATLILSSIARAEGPTTPISVGGMIGMAVPSSVGTSSRFTWGVEGDYHLLPEVTAGAYFLTSSQDNSIPPIISSSRISLYGLQGRYLLSGIPGLSVGARLGLAHFSIDVSSGAPSTSTNDLSVGP